MKNKILIVLALICILIMLFFWPGKDEKIAKDADEKEAQYISQMETESLAHNITLYDQSGKDCTMRELYNKKPVYVLFWMPWSELSITQLDILEDVYHRYGHQVYFVILAAGKSEEEMQTFFVNHDYDLPFYTADISAASDYNVNDVPQSLMIARYGQITGRKNGVLDSRELAYMIEKGSR